MLQNELFNNVMQDFNTGYWELHIDPYRENWSERFYEILGYSKDEVQSNFDYFLEHLIHKEDIDVFRDNFLNYRINTVNFKQHIKILNAKGNYQLFRCVTNDALPVNIKAEASFVFFFEIKLEPDKTIKKDNFYYKETAQMTATGSWYVDFHKKESSWDFETYRILEYPEDYKPSLKDSANYYSEDHRQLAADCFFNCAMMGTPFNTEIKMVTANNREFWARAIGKPIYNENKEIIGIRGVFQDIDDIKRKEVSLQKSVDIIAAQNSRLFNFAHIVSHNLRSHTSNLSLLVQLIEDIDDPKEKEELIKEVKTISTNLNTTIEHLNEIVTIQTNNKQERVPIKFKDALKLVVNGISHMISNSNADIQADFNEVEEIAYIPAYLESILLNLITNAIKYKHPDREPIIFIKTYVDDGNKFLKVSDNGVGIDLKLFKDKVFGMYKTFHYNKDAVGIGLFLTKNQVESMDGTISVESEVNKGTTFTIGF
ncbi:PAS domain-containing sensor histidine kinase [Aquimarina sp. MMG015]|uniref:PAS domain-containing sensor histidine kinase n=1 Tax=Aquimarina TaxID=290174 RepID=UPI000487CFBC|nr:MULTISPECIES: PAS domain-containing sensor histidine kinase [Aquimarina]AXT57226.1 PAS domain-containing protein [Aquimarina sp. AD1]MBQ4801540.1 PAS domain-containing sensor histidine kinase [Aquimarina sp. MMG015]RKN29070.1 PAS domain-containing protein [Aquimarina sp. AD1]